MRRYPSLQAGPNQDSADRVVGRHDCRFHRCSVGAGKIAAVLGLIVSTVLLALNSYTKNYDLGELAQKHKQAGNDLWLISEKYLSLLVDLAMREKPLESLQEQRDQLVAQLHAVYSGAPSTMLPAYKKAQEALQKLEDMTFSDAEIDAFLPGELKRSSPAREALNRELGNIVPKDSAPRPKH